MDVTPLPCLTSARSWYAGLAEPAQSVAWRNQVEVRRFTATPKDVVQPALAENILCMHLGGAKQVRRSTDGHVSEHLVEPGSLTIMPARQANRWLTRGPIDYAHLILSDSLLSAVAMEDFDRDPARVELCATVGMRSPWLEPLFRQVLDAISAQPATASLHLEGLLIVLAASLLRDHSVCGGSARANPVRATGGLAPWRLRRVVDHMHAHLSEDVALATLTELTGLSRAQFFRGFKQSTGASPARHLHDIRLETARRLLTDTDLEEAEIGRRVGLDGQLATAFRQRYGASPRLYRLAKA